MKTFSLNNLVLILFLVVLTSSFLFSQKDDIKSNELELKKLENSIIEIRRDQLNYQIERDLLKETFSSNYQTVNIVLTIVLGVFSILGFLGIKDIGAIKNQYHAELEKMNDLRRNFESAIKQYKDDQLKVKEDYIQILSANEEQNRRLKVLELQEKVDSLVSGKNYQRALEYIIPALELDPKNIILLNHKGTCLWRIKDYIGSINEYQKVVEIEPNNIFAVENIAELYIITNQIDEFDLFYKKHKSVLQSISNGVLIIYFDTLRNYINNNVDEMKRIIRGYIESLTQEKSKKTNWDFTDIVVAFSPKNDEAKGALLLLLISILKGELNNLEAINKFNAIS